MALNNENNNSIVADDECVEFIGFYSHSSLKNIFPYFFNGMNKIIIKSAINLQLFTIIITYHLSLNPNFLNKLIKELKNIFIISKNNFYLLIKKIELFYGEKYIMQNEIYFKIFNNKLSEKGFLNLNENQIVKIINSNCYKIVNIINKILNVYKTIDKNYYQDFNEIFSSISKITETNLYNYFYNHLYSNSSKEISKPTKISTNENENNINNNSIKIKTNFKNNEKEFEVKTFLKYNKFKISPPFLKKPCEKKYTLVLDLEETLISINKDGICEFRPGLFSFLNAIRPYYEIISFTNESKFSSDSIIKQIEAKNKYFDYNLYREHLFFNGKEFIKDISKLGRDIKKIIIVDNISNNFKLNPENGIQIAPYFGELTKNDTVLFELKKLLIMISKSGFEDIRIAIKKYSKDIKKNITKEIDDYE